MSFSDPRGDLPSLGIHLITPQILPTRRSFRKLPKGKNHKKLPCYDWIFSSATNIHIAVDKSSFKTFTPFDSYILTVAGQQRVHVRGIGSVDLKIRCRPNGRDSRLISLDNVLYVPSWPCNIFSDCYFDPPHDFEHLWIDNGVCFSKKVHGRIKAWGYTESFCGLDRLVLSRKPRGRSPMLEDKEREVWSVNLRWPQSQRDKWQAFYNKELQRMAREHEAEIMAQQQKAEKKEFTASTELLLPKTQSPKNNLKSGSPASVAKLSVHSLSEKCMARVMARQVSVASLDLAQAGARMSLNEISRNVAIKTDPESRVSSLKAKFSTERGLLKDFLAVQGKGNRAT